jgi:hypothetical protein
MGLLSTDNNTITLSIKDYSPYYEFFNIGPAAIYPGMLLQRETSIPPYDEGVQPHSTPGGFNEKLFATENWYQGKTIFTPYIQSERVMARCYRPGDRVLALYTGTLPLVEEQVLASASSGYLRPWNGAGERPVAISQRGIPTGGALPAYIEVRVL